LFRIAESNYHNYGFWLKTSDDKCFNGESFATCDRSSRQQSWGWGFKVEKNGDINSYLYLWNDKSQCLLNDRGVSKVGPCDSYSYRTPRQWELKHGKLSSNSGRDCVVRSLQGDAHIVKCTVGFEYLEMSPVLVFSRV
jgi:hypothetical protein